jgi:sulfite reductase (NADPH) flavoprotein alpha-component
MYVEVSIHYSSQSGTAEHFCEMMQEDGHVPGVNTNLVHLKDFDKEQFEKQKFVVFILSTHYEG